VCQSSVRPSAERRPVLTTTLATYVNTAGHASGILVPMARPILRASVKERSYARLAMDRGLLPTQRAVSGATRAMAPPLALGDLPRPAMVGALAARSPGASQRPSADRGGAGRRSMRTASASPPATSCRHPLPKARWALTKDEAANDRPLSFVRQFFVAPPLQLIHLRPYAIPLALIRPNSRRSDARGVLSCRHAMHVLSPVIGSVKRSEGAI
jgi:hypothetical protein